MTAPHLRQWPGNADRPAIALHCMMGNASYWRPIAAALSDRVQITAPDLPGHGQSPDWDGGDVDFHTVATRQAAALIQRPVDLIGHSVGATIALRIAVAAPEAVRSLTLIEPVLFAAAHDPECETLLEAVAERYHAGDMAGAAERFLQVWGGLSWDAQTPAAQARMQRQIALVASSNAVLRQDSAQILRDGGLEAIDAPVLLIRGTQSPGVVEKIADALADRLQDVGRAEVPGAGHMLPLTHPKQVADLIGLNIDRA